MGSETPQPKGKGRHGLSASDRVLWHHAIRDATPLQGRITPQLSKVSAPSAPKLHLPPDTQTADTTAVTANRAPLSPIVMPRPDTKAHAFDGLDRRTAERLSRGRIAIDGRLDLHGMTQNQARDALDAFIARAWDQGKRALLIITGKGTRIDETRIPWQNGMVQNGMRHSSLGQATGVLRASVPRWLHEHPNRSRVLAVTEAEARHGGTGALYVLIRRRRD